MVAKRKMSIHNGHVKVCQLCGKSTGKINYWTGCFVSYAHEECLLIADKGISFWLRKVLTTHHGFYWMSKRVIGEYKEMFPIKVEKGECDGKDKME